jgi:hypothetical protein
MNFQGPLFLNLYHLFNKTDTYGAENILLYRAGVLAGKSNAGTFGGTMTFTRLKPRRCAQICLPKQRISGSS